MLLFLPAVCSLTLFIFYLGFGRTSRLFLIRQSRSFSNLQGARRWRRGGPEPLAAPSGRDPCHLCSSAAVFCVNNIILANIYIMGDNSNVCPLSPWFRKNNFKNMEPMFLAIRVSCNTLKGGCFLRCLRSTLPLQGPLVL